MNALHIPTVNTELLHLPKIEELVLNKSVLDFKIAIELLIVVDYRVTRLVMLTN